MTSVFIGSNGIRAGWRMLIFVALIAAELLLLVGLFKLFHLPMQPPKGKHAPPLTAWTILLADAALFGFVLLAAFIMSKIEKRPMGLYGIPLRQAFGAKFWMGALIGFTGISVVIGMIELAGGGRPFRWIACADARARRRIRPMLACISRGWVLRRVRVPGLRSVYVIHRHVFLARRDPHIGVLRIHAHTERR